MKRKLPFRNDLPETCFSVLPSSGQLIIIRCGERGCGETGYLRNAG